MMMKTLPTLFTAIALSAGALGAHPHPDAPQSKLEHLAVAADHLEAAGAVREAESLRKHVAVLQEREEKAKEMAAANETPEVQVAKPAAVSKPVQVIVEKGEEGSKSVAIVGVQIGEPQTAGEVAETKEGATPMCCMDGATKSRAALLAGDEAAAVQAEAVAPEVKERADGECEDCAEGGCEDCAKVAEKLESIDKTLKEILSKMN